MRRETVKTVDGKTETDFGIDERKLFDYEVDDLASDFREK
jgi:hypothetical protein